MRWPTITLAALLLAAPLAACDGNPTAADPASGNLIPNGSFEQDGRGSLDTWQLPTPSLASLSPEAAPGGGGWSLRLAADAAPSSGQARFAVPLLRDGDVVRLSAHVRALGASGGARVGLEVRAGDGRLRQSESASSVDTDWAPVTLTETLSLQSGDTVWVVLSSPPTQLAARAGLFDLIRLERIGR